MLIGTHSVTHNNLCRHTNVQANDWSQCFLKHQPLVYFSYWLASFFPPSPSPHNLSNQDKWCLSVVRGWFQFTFPKPKIAKPPTINVPSQNCTYGTCFVYLITISKLLQWNVLKNCIGSSINENKILLCNSSDKSFWMVNTTLWSGFHSSSEAVNISLQSKPRLFNASQH